MAKTKTVTLSVHRAIFDEKITFTLSDLLGRIKQDVIATKDRIVADRSLIDKIAISFPQFPKSNEAVAARFGLYEEGSEQSTIQFGKPEEGFTTNKIPAPEQAEFLDHQVVILADGNYMLACGLGTRNNMLVDAIGQFASQCGIKLPPTSFHLTNTPNTLTLDRIRSVGVRGIRFDAANYLGSLDIPKDSLIGSIFGAMSTTEEFERQEMVAEVSIETKRLRKPRLVSKETPRNEWLTRTAARTMQSEEVGAYTIILEDGTEWRDGELKLGTYVKVPQDGSTYRVPDALQCLLDYRQELLQKGLLN